MATAATMQRQGKSTAVSQALRAISDNDPIFTPTTELCFSNAEGFRIVIADTREQRESAYKLVYEAYETAGYNVAFWQKNRCWFTLHHCHPEAVTMLAFRGDTPVATLTVLPDSILGLPADAIFPETTSGLREKGRKLCEIASLAVADEAREGGRTILLLLFKAAWILAARHFQGTDLIAAVMAHHAEFYRRILLFESHAESRTSPKTGEPVRFCRLDLQTAERLYALRYSGISGKANLHRFFVHDVEQIWRNWNDLNRHSLSLDDMLYFASEKSDVIRILDDQNRRRLHHLFPLLPERIANSQP